MNDLKIYVNSNMRIRDIKDSTLLVSGSSNANYLEVYLDEARDTNVVLASFARADGQEIRDVQLEYVENRWVLAFTTDMRILEVPGPLQISIRLLSVDANSDIIWAESLLSFTCAVYASMGRWF